MSDRADPAPAPRRGYRWRGGAAGDVRKVEHRLLRRDGE
jgi:hypothetical protein